MPGPTHARVSRTVSLICLVAILLLLLATAACVAAPASQSNHKLVQTNYKVTDAISNLPGVARVTNADTVNPWGVAYGPTGLGWVADNGAGVATVFRRDAFPRLVRTVTIPPPAGGTDPATPTGLVYNPTSSFEIADVDSPSAPARFLFATEDGTISGWSPDVDPDNAILAVDRSLDGANYKGLTRALGPSGQQLYATNFTAGVVDVFDANFALLGSFTDPTVPAGFAPFGIRTINGQIWVTFAKQSTTEPGDDEHGPGNGFIDIFEADGTPVSRFASQGELNSPWGLAVAPSRFGIFSKALLVGNFGDGHINAYDIATGDFLGAVSYNHGRPIDIDGVWGLTFFTVTDVNGNDRPILSWDVDLTFAAGIDDEANGLVGSIEPDLFHGFGR